GLAGQQRPQPFGLGVGQVQRIVEGTGVLVAQDPVGAAAGQPAVQALDLDQVQAAAGGDQQVHLVHVAGVGGEGEVGPGPVRLGVGQQLADVLQRLPFQLELG